MKIKSRNKSIARVAPFHLWGAKLGPFVFIIAALALFSLSAVNPGTLEGARARTTDFFAPLLSTLNKPFYQATEYVRTVSGLSSLQAENARLRQENEKLRDWYQTALSLRAENENLHKLLNIKLAPQHHFITARIVADSGNAFAKSLLVKAGKNDGITNGQAVLASDGLVGRIIESGKTTARVLLLTDMNSRIPVLLQDTNQRAILAGTNDNFPVLLHLPPEINIEEGGRVITSGHGGLFPYGLPVGEIIKRDGKIIVKPYAAAEHTNIVRVIEQTDDPHLKSGESKELP